MEKLWWKVLVVDGSSVDLTADDGWSPPEEKLFFLYADA